MTYKMTAMGCLMLLGLTLGVAQAKVSTEEAATLKTTLTPFGAERAGNAEGTIPEWTGGLTEVPAGYVEGEHLPNPFAGEKPLFTITAENYEQYKDNLTDSQVAMFKKYPEKFRMPIYPTHRTATAPKWVQDNTYQAALNATLTEDGNGVLNACGAIPFPIPKSGLEVVQNHLMRWQGSSLHFYDWNFSGYENAPSAAGSTMEIYWQYPYYQEGGNCEGGGLFSFDLAYDSPARRKGELLLVNDFTNASKNPREAWQYIPGQRRVRRAPTVAFDAPDTPIAAYEDAYVYNGSPEKFNWKLIGKKEVYIPYNGYDMAAFGDKLTKEDYLPGYPDADKYFRWELHRVWVVEGIRKEDVRHIYGSRKLYIDEDSWAAVIHDRWDNKGNLWLIQFANIMQYPNGIHGPSTRPMFTKDLLSGEYYAAYNSIKPMEGVEPLPEQYFTPQGVRKRSKR